MKEYYLVLIILPKLGLDCIFIMYNQPVYIANGRSQVRVYQQSSNLLGSQMNQRIIVQPQQYRPPAPQVTKIVVVDGILI